MKKISFGETLKAGLPILLIACTLKVHASTQYTWSASSGLLPNQVDARMTLNDTANPENPVLENGILALATSANEELLGYVQSGNDIDIPDQLKIEFDLRVGAGSIASTSTGTVSPRTWASVVFLTATGTGNAAFFSQDKIFVLAQGDRLGVSTTAFDTNDAFHSYKILVSGKSAGSVISIFQDNSLVLTSSVFSGDPFGGGSPRIVWGDQTFAAQGLSEWKSFVHNASAVPEPAVLLTMLLGLSVVLRSSAVQTKSTEA